jgi:hypothetical protein
MIKRPIVLVLVLAALAAAAPAETRLGGYFSLDYLKGKAPDPYAGGSVQNFAAGLLVSGELSAAFGYMLEVRASAVDRVDILQAWASFLGSDSFHVRVGLFLVPFGKYNESARAFQTRLVEAPWPAGRLAPAAWRELGAVAEGRLGPVTYAAYIGNGLAEAGRLADGQQFKDDNADKGRGLRLGLLWGSNLEIGGSYYAGKMDARNERGLTLLGFDAAWTTENIRLTGEYAKAKIANPSPFAEGSAEGWYAELALKFGAWTPLAAYQKGRTDDPFHGAGFDAAGVPGAGIFERRSLWAIGVVYALDANLLLKGEYDFSVKDETGIRSPVIRIQAAAHF